MKERENTAVPRQYDAPSDFCAELLAEQAERWAALRR